LMLNANCAPSSLRGSSECWMDAACAAQKIEQGVEDAQARK
jgi:hypothetical protein